MAEPLHGRFPTHLTCPICQAAVPVDAPPSFNSAGWNSYADRALGRHIRTECKPVI
jgi:hypothetical protein